MITFTISDQCRQWSPSIMMNSLSRKDPNTHRTVMFTFAHAIYPARQYAKQYYRQLKSFQIDEPWYFLVN